MITKQNVWNVSAKSQKIKIISESEEKKQEMRLRNLDSKPVAIDSYRKYRVMQMLCV